MLASHTSLQEAHTSPQPGANAQARMFIRGNRQVAMHKRMLVTKNS